MQTLIFTQKLLRQRRFLNFLLPLFAIFGGLGMSQNAAAQTFADNAITLNVQQSGGTASSANFKGRALDTPYTTYTPLGNIDTSTPSPALGTFDLNGNSTLTLTGGAAVIDPPSRGASAVSARVLYRVFLTRLTPAQLSAVSYQQLNLPDQGPFPAYPADRLFSTSTANSNLLNGLSSGGNYTVQVRFQTTNSDGSTTTDPTANYTFTFDVTPPSVTPAGGETTWISDGVAPRDANWLNAANWDNGVPTRFADAFIPEKVLNNQAAFTVTPVIDNPSLTYEVRNLTLNGATNSTRALLRIGNSTGAAGGLPIGGTLSLYGDLNVYGGGVLAAVSGTNGTANPLTNSTIALLGDDQTIRGLLEIADIRIAGTGYKNVVNSVNASNTFTFAPGVSAIVRTVLEDSRTTPSTFTLNTTKTSSVNLKSTGTLFGETNTAYILGIALSDRNIVAGVKQTFGNIGIDITSNRDIPGATIQITRTVGDPLNGPIGRSARPIKRQYGVSGDVNVAPTVSTVVFHYLDSADELNGIPEANLILFRTTNNGIPYIPEYGVLDDAANTVTRTNMTAINTLTIGDSANPLPVTLTSLEAKRVGSNAVITWSTASEKDNKGYNVQVSTNGTDFRTLGFVSTTSPNSSTTNVYSYVDTEKNKTTQRYYRLQQVDLSGKETFYGPRLVSFEGEIAVSEGTGAALVAYPNPFNSADEMHLALESALAGTGAVTVTDMTGRIVRQQKVALNTGSNTVTVERLNDLKAGMYLIRLTLPNGKSQSLKVAKQ